MSTSNTFVIAIIVNFIVAIITVCLKKKNMIETASDFFPGAAIIADVILLVIFGLSNM